MTNAPIEIPLSKTKLLLLLAGSLAFVAAGLWFVIRPPVSSYSLHNNPVLVFSAGIAAILLFGLFAVLIIRKLPDRRPGLIIDASGITDNSSAVSAGQVPWHDIEALSVAEVQRQKFILVLVKDPQLYIQRQASAFKRKAMALNHRYYGTPITISANGLKIKFEELNTLLNDRLKASRGKI